MTQPALVSEISDFAQEKHFSPQQLADLWGLHPKTIRSLFLDEPGVLVYGTEETRFKRPHRTLRIPESVALRVHRRLRVRAKSTKV